MNLRFFRLAGLSLSALSVALAAPAMAQDDPNQPQKAQADQAVPAGQTAQEAIPGDQ